MMGTGIFRKLTVFSKMDEENGRVRRISLTLQNLLVTVPPLRVHKTRCGFKVFILSLTCPSDWLQTTWERARPVEQQSHPCSTCIIREYKSICWRPTPRKQAAQPANQSVLYQEDEALKSQQNLLCYVLYSALIWKALVCSLPNI